MWPLRLYRKIVWWLWSLPDLHKCHIKQSSPNLEQGNLCTAVSIRVSKTEFHWSWGTTKTPFSNLALLQRKCFLHFGCESHPPATQSSSWQHLWHGPALHRFICGRPSWTKKDAAPKYDWYKTSWILGGPNKFLGRLLKSSRHGYRCTGYRFHRLQKAGYATYSFQHRFIYHSFETPSRCGGSARRKRPWRPHCHGPGYDYDRNIHASRKWCRMAVARWRLLYASEH